MIDLDHFKKINDKFGHVVGDEVLKIFSEILQKETRKADVCARIGGEEFACIFLNSNIDVSMIVAERIRKKLENTTIETANRTAHVTCSIGMCSVEHKFESFEDLLKESDNHLYKAKTNGKNQIVR